MFAGEVSAPAFTIESRRSVARLKCNGSCLVDGVGFDAKGKTTHIETLDQS
jgi:hypothetical protein